MGGKDRLRKWARKKANYNTLSRSNSMYQTSHTYTVRWRLTLYPIRWMSPIRSPQCELFGFFYYWRCTDFETWRPVIPANPQHKFTPKLLGVIEPGSKETDIGMQLSLTTVWVINILLSISVSLSLSPSFFFPSLRDPWLRDWLPLREAHWWCGVMWNYCVSRPATLVTAGKTIKK